MRDENYDGLEHCCDEIFGAQAQKFDLNLDLWDEAEQTKEEMLWRRNGGVLQECLVRG